MKNSHIIDYPFILPRYLIQFDGRKLPVRVTDALVVGSGIAGLRAAIALADSCDVLVLTKDRLQESNSYLAQGGIAAAIGEDDNVEVHMKDTLDVGKGISNKKAVEVLVDEGRAEIHSLIEFGAKFDRTESNKLAFTMEGAHSRKRILHAGGDAIGIELELTLIRKASSIERIKFLEGYFLVDILTFEDRAVGAIIFDVGERRLELVSAKAIVMATGGAGHIFLNTSNSHIATGDGVAAALRAGATVADMEFVQFHPTTLHLEGAPRFLISEAVRGEGGLLYDVTGNRFMENFHPLKELAPRDEVSRAIILTINKTGFPNVFLDISHRPPEFVKKRFPKIYMNCLKYGIDITYEPIPVKPAAHYLIGGIMTGLDGQTTISGLYAAGECACTGVHGANRLASNSLLECVVFGRRAGVAAARYISSAERFPVETLSYEPSLCEKRRMLNSSQNLAVAAGGGEDISRRIDYDVFVRELKKTAWDWLGVFRDSEGLEKMMDFLKRWQRIKIDTPKSRKECVATNMLEVAEMIAFFASKREESRGVHYRVDFPATSSEGKYHRVLQNHKAGIVTPDEDENWPVNI